MPRCARLAREASAVRNVDGHTRVTCDVRRATCVVCRVRACVQVVEKFVELAARNGMDVFRIFDCFNDVSQMQVAIDAVRKARKVAEVCICYTADVLTRLVAR